MYLISKSCTSYFITSILWLKTIRHKKLSDFWETISSALFLTRVSSRDCKALEFVREMWAGYSACHDMRRFLFSRRYNFHLRESQKGEEGGGKTTSLNQPKLIMNSRFVLNWAHSSIAFFALNDPGDWFGIRNVLNWYILDFITSLWTSECILRAWNFICRNPAIAGKAGIKATRTEYMGDACESAFKFLFCFSIHQVWNGLGEQQGERGFLYCTNSTKESMRYGKLIQWRSSLLTLKNLFLDYFISHLPVSWWL